METLSSKFGQVLQKSRNSKKGLDDLNRTMEN